MRFTKTQAILIGLLVLTVAGGLGYWLTRPATPTPPAPAEVATTTTSETITDATPPSASVIGHSVEGREIIAQTFGSGSTTILFVGGIHGGYEWNSVLLAYDILDSFATGDITVPPGLQVAIIPNLNPDGVYAVIGKEGRFSWADIPADDSQTNGRGRFNAHQVDLNRNFACRWQATSTWRGKPVSAGSSAFSEPEATALRDYVATMKPAGVIFWHSQANAVYGAECGKGVLPGTLQLLTVYATAAGYEAVPTFDAYPVSGDAEGWLASVGIPAITVELSSHATTDWPKNLAGVQAVLAHFE